MSHIALVNYEASTLRIYVETSTVSIISEQPLYMYPPLNLNLNIVATFRGMHVSPAKTYLCVTAKRVIPMCCYAMQATQKV